MSAVSMKQVAQQAGVSAMTVSHALRGTGRISDETRQRVKRTAFELGHRPNRSAQATRQQRFGSASLVLSDDPARSAADADLLRGIHRGLGTRGMQLSIAELDDARLTSDDYMGDILHALSADGLLINYKWQTPPALVELIDRHRIPAVWLSARRRHDAVYADLEQGVAEATRRSIEAGHRRIGLVQPARNWLDTSQPGMHYSVEASRAGYEAAMAEAGLPTDPTFCIREDAEELITQLRRPDRPTAVVCQGIHVVARVRLAAATCGWDVPGDLSLVAVCHETKHHLGLSFAQSVMPAEAVGRVGVDMLLEKIADPGPPLEARAIPMPWKDGPTLAPPRSR